MALEILDFYHERSILTEMSPSEVLEHPQMRSLIGCDITLRHIEDMKTSSEKNLVIIQHVKSGGQPAYDTLKVVLQETKHYKLLQDLHRLDLGIPVEASDLWPRVCEMTLKTCQQTIRDDLDPTSILDRFEESEFTYNSKIRDIKEQPTTTEKNRMISFEIRKQGVTGYKTFKDILEETKQDGVYDKLEEAEMEVFNTLVTSQDILEDYMCYHLNRSGLKCDNNPRLESNGNIELFTRMRELCTEFEDRYKAQLGHMMDEPLRSQEINQSIYTKVLHEVFKDAVNWGRIIAVVSLGGAMAISCQKHGRSKDAILSWTVEYLKKHVEQWIVEKGGWTAILDDFYEATSDNQDDVDGDIQAIKSGQESIHITAGNATSQVKKYAHLLLAIAGAFAIGVAVGRR